MTRQRPEPASGVRPTIHQKNGICWIYENDAPTPIQNEALKRVLEGICKWGFAIGFHRFRSVDKRRNGISAASRASAPNRRLGHEGGEPKRRVGVPKAA